MIKYISIFWLVLRCLLVPKKENLTGFSTGLTGRSKNLDPTGRSTRPVSISDLYVKFQTLKLKDMIRSEFAKFIFKFKNNMLL